MYRYHNNLSLGASRLVALVGVGVRPQARLVLRGGLRRSDLGARSTTPATWSPGGWPCRPSAFVAWQAFRRRSAALALIAIAFAVQWISWARIDRAAFQYHYYTALPFVFLALAYFLAELWHGTVAPHLAACAALRRRRGPRAVRAVAVPSAAVRDRARDRHRPELAGVPDADSRT